MNNKIDIKEKAAQLLCFAFQGTEYNDQLKTLVEDLKVGGIIYFSRNIKNSSQVLELNKEIRKKSQTPMFIGLDQEGGVVQRIKDITLFPGAMALSASLTINTKKICYQVGRNLASLGFNINFAPVGDVNNNSLNPVINSRSYSDDPYVVAKDAVEAFEGFQKANILPTIKHFLGHGDTVVDSHVGLPTVNKTRAELENMEIIPFKKAIEEGIDGIMLSHILYPAFDEKYPASLSKKIVTNYLKEELSFEGLIVTDSLTMGAINANFSSKEILKLAVNAGVDMMIFCGKADINDQKKLYNELLELIDSGEIPISRIEESYQKIIKYKNKYYSQRLPKLVIDNKLSLKASLESITLVRDGGLLPIKKEDKVLLIFPKIEIASLVDDEKNEYKTLNEFLNVEEIIINISTIEDEEKFHDIVEKSKNYDKIIMATYNVSDNDYQVKLYNNLDNDKTIIISMRSPYDILHLEKAKKQANSYICIYEATSLSFSSLSKCLCGENSFTGKLPIKLGGK